MRFEKWQALGNDYIVVEAARAAVRADAGARARRSAPATSASSPTGSCCCREPTQPGFVARLTIFNPDGSEAELSGNGAREAIMYLRRRGWTDSDVFSIETAAGEIRPTITGPTTCRVDMGRAKLTSKDYPGGAEDGSGEIGTPGRLWALPARLDRQPAVRDARRLGRGAGGARPAGARAVRSSAASCSPTARTSRGTPSWRPTAIRARIFERGVGETLSSGTGATGAAVAHVLRGGDSPVVVRARRRRADRRGGRGPAREPDRLGGPGVRRDALRRLPEGAACDRVSAST